MQVHMRQGDCTCKLDLIGPTIRVNGKSNFIKINYSAGPLVFLRPGGCIYCVLKVKKYQMTTQSLKCLFFSIRRNEG